MVGHPVDSGAPGFIGPQVKSRRPFPCHIVFPKEVRRNGVDVRNLAFSIAQYHPVRDMVEELDRHSTHLCMGFARG